jgi:hypothetical protein
MSVRDFMLRARKNLREEEEQDEEDGDYASEKHPATPAIPGTIAVVAVAAIGKRVSTKVEGTGNDERIMQIF